MSSTPSGYDALRNSAAWLDVSARGKIIASGEDRARLLHAMTTNHVQQLTPGTGAYAYFLTAQGRILADVNLICRPDHFLLDTEPETHEKLFKHLDSFIIADDVTIDDATGRTMTIAVEGPEAPAVMEKLGAPTPSSDLDNAEWEQLVVVRASATGSNGFFVIGPLEHRDTLISKLESAGSVAGSPEAFNIVRIENGHPRYGEDISERYLSQETNQPRAMHFQKGCYLGQEIVERVRSRGQVHRILVPVQIEGGDPPPPGAKLQVAGNAAAEITSAVYSPGLGKVAALAYVRMDHSAPGSELSLDGRVARVVKGR